MAKRSLLSERPSYFQMELNTLGLLKFPTENNLQRCFSNWVPQRGVRGSERRKCVLGEEFYWRSINLYVRIEISCGDIRHWSFRQR